jgi:hypothetical protein
MITLNIKELHISFITPIELNIKEISIIKLILSIKVYTRVVALFYGAFVTNNIYRNLK